MNPPKCPACGHEHWQIEGCGPAEVKTEINIGGRSWTREEVVPSTMRPLAYDMIERPELVAQNVLGKHEHVPDEDLLAFDIAQAQQALIDSGFRVAGHGEVARTTELTTGLAAAGPAVEFTQIEPSETEKDYLYFKEHGPLRGATEAMLKSRAQTKEAIGDQIALLKDEGDALRRIRKGLKMSQPKFGETFGIAPGTLRGWENGRHKIPPYVMVLLKIIQAEPKAVFRALGVKP